MKALFLPMSFALPFSAPPLGALRFGPLLRGTLFVGVMAMALVAWPETGGAFQASDSADLPADQGAPPKLTAPQAKPSGSSVPDVYAPTTQQSSAAASRPDTPLPANEKEIGFAADQLNYDSNNDVVTASGNVQMLREGNRLRANTVTWNRKTGAVEASGNVSVTDPQGNIAYGDRVEVTDALKDGVVQNLLLVLAEGGRLVAKDGNRVNGVYQLNQAAYSPCAVEASDGCPKQPSWQIKAVRVRYDPTAQRVTYKHARIELFGVPILVLPGFSHPMGEGGGSGFLVPNAQINAINGLEIMLPYYWKIAPNRDLTITPHVFTGVAPMLEGTYRAFVGNGAYRVTGFATYSQKRQTNLPTDPSQGDFRGYIDAVGKFQLDPEWSVSGSIRRSSDRTFLRRYDISRDDRLRSSIRAERIDADSYLSIAGWAVQTLRLTDSQGQMPVALPVIDYRLRLPSPVLGGRVQFQANSLAIARADGQDTQRAFASAMWNLRRLTTWGQELTLTAFGRGDIYHSSNNDLNPIAAYRGTSGWQGRGIAALAAELRWPFIGEFLGGTQRITPRVQIVAAPKLRNLSIPNEDARSIDLEDSNLFALNRFPGYDRFEDSTRITYGLEYALELPRFSIETVVGQSYRLNSRSTLLPDGTGLSDRMSDIVGRTTLRYRNLVSVTHRFRLDKDNLAVRRNEIDATVGTRRTYATVSYLRLDRNATLQQEDLQDREELRLGTRIAFAKFWSVFGSTVIDLTSKKEDPLTLADGFAPVRHRFGVAYQDDCLDIGLTWRRNYRSTGDARNNNTIQLQLAFRNLGI
jgi:LPS-assembly protein